MLRITKSAEGGIILLKLEGKLLAPWTPAVLEQCDGASAALRLDLSHVSFADGAGIALLNNLRARGATVVACSAYVAELLQPEKP